MTNRLSLSGRRLGADFATQAGGGRGGCVGASGGAGELTHAAARAGGAQLRSRM